MAPPAALSLTNVSKKFRVYRQRPSTLKQVLSGRGRFGYEDVTVLHDISLDLTAGSTLGIVGHNGSGKSTLLRIMAGIYKPTSGVVTANGQVASLMELGAGFHPELSGRDNVFLNGGLMGLSRAQIRERFEGIVEFAGVGDYIDTPVKHYSSGMYVRLGFSIAVNVDADIILIDEVIAVGDAEFQQRCKDHIKALARAGRTIVLVSHMLADVKDLSDEVVWLDHGSVIAAGAPDEVTNDYVKAVREQTLPERDNERPVAIESIALLDASGNGVIRGITGEPLIVRVYYRATSPVERPIFRLAFDDVTGVAVAASDTRIEPRELTRISGRGHIDYKIQRLPLVAGSYLISAWLYEATFSCAHDALERSFVLDVDPGSSGARQGVLDLGGHWMPGIE